MDHQPDMFQVTEPRRVLPRFEAHSPSPKKQVTIKAVILHDNEGNYFIHGTNSTTPKEMMKAALSLWEFDPSKEAAQYVEFKAWLPDLDHVTKPNF